MSQNYENLILNPAEFTSELTEIDLSDNGLAFGEPGPDYGEASQTVERVRQALGEGVTDAHWPSVECSIPLVVGARRDVAVANAFAPVEGFVSEVQRRHRGWIKRVFADVAGFSGAVACPVDSAGITTPRGKDGVDQITMKLSRHPFWYATAEVEAGEAEGSEVRDLQIMLAELLGTAPGLIRIVVKNEGEEDWRACAVAVECDDYSSAETAEPVYSAKNLTVQGGSEVATEDEEEVVKCPPLTAGFVTVLSSEIGGEVGHMTHVGPRHVRVRQKSAEATLWKLEWRALGAATWVPTMEGSTPIIVETPVTEDWQVLDLGECLPERAITGDQRWEWRLQARMVEGSGAQPLIRDVYVESCEQRAVVTDTSDTVIDGEPSRAPGSIADNGAESGRTVEWEVAEEVEIHFEGEGKSHWLRLEDFGFDGLPSSASLLGITADFPPFGARNGVPEYVEVTLMDGSEPVGEAQALDGDAIPRHATWDLDEIKDAGVDRNSVEESGFGFGIALTCRGPNLVDPVEKIFRLTVTYADAAEENRICFVSRLVEFTDTGPRRQHPTEDVWGELIPKGNNFHAPVPGQAGNSARALIVPSVGDLAERADSDPVSLSAKVTYRPAYLFAREAAEG